MAAQLKPLKTPFTNMSYTPDVPASALGPNEYNSGFNIETDTRAIKSVLGEIPILSTIPGNAIFITGGFRQQQSWWYVVATEEGKWYGITATGITNITPGVGTDPNAHLTGYTTELAITDTWNGNVLFINDSINPPLYLLPTATEFAEYSNDPTANLYVWNYNENWTALSAGFMRLYSTPNVGSILVAGNLTATQTGGTITNYPNTVRWSQAFGLNSGPLTWAPTITNVANEFEVPVRGPVIDGFPCNGNFYVCSYWDTVVFQPLNYQSTSAPILGVKLMNQGRGLLNENCWANADQDVYGLDARDIWSFDGSNFISLGNQKVKDWFYANLNPQYYYLTQMINNTSKNQIEIYFADMDSTGMCNQMLAYRYDLKIWQAPRQISSAVHANEGPRYTTFTGPHQSGPGFNLSTRGAVYVQGNTPNSRIVEKDIGYQFVDGSPITAEFRRDNITFTPDIPYSMEVLIHRILPEVIAQNTSNIGNINITIGGAGSVGAVPTFQDTIEMPIDTETPWTQVNQNQYRAVSVIANATSDSNGFTLSAIDWQLTQVSDSR